MKASEIKVGEEYAATPYNYGSRGPGSIAANVKVIAVEDRDSLSKEERDEFTRRFRAHTYGKEFPTHLGRPVRAKVTDTRGSITTFFGEVGNEVIVPSKFLIATVNDYAAGVAAKKIAHEKRQQAIREREEQREAQNRRVNRQAAILNERGYPVKVRGSVYDPHQLIIDPDVMDQIMKDLGIPEDSH